MSAALKQQLRALADARADRVAVADQLSALRAAFDAENADLIAQLGAHTATVATLESEVRALALHTFDVSQDKKPAPGVEIVLAAKMDYDESAAFTWARERKMALVPESLDKKAFEKIAKATFIDFVTYRQEPAVRIATQLNAAVYAEAEPVVLGEIG